MSNCVNKEHPEVKALAFKLGLSVPYTASAIGVWQERMGSDLFPQAFELKEFLDKNQSSVSIPEVTNPRKKGLAQEIMLTLAEKIQFAIPGVTIEYGYNLGDGTVAQRKGSTLYFDLAKITPDTPMHEFGHIWLDILENTDPKQFDIVEREIKQLLANNRELSRAMQEKYPELSGRKFYKEVAAFALGYRTESKVTAFVKERGIKDDTLIGKILGVVQKISELLAPSMKKFFGTNTNINLGQSLNQIFDQLADDILANKKLFQNDPMLTRDLSSYINEDDVDDQRIGNMKELFTELSVNGGSRFLRDTYSDAKLAATFIKTDTIRPNKKTPEEGKYMFESKFLKIPLDSKSKEEVMKKVLPIYRKLDREFKNVIKLTLNDYIHADRKQTISAYGKQRFSDIGVDSKYIKDSMFESLLTSLNLDGGTVDVMLYSELKDSIDPELKEMFHKDMVGDDFIILVHSDLQGKKEVSVLDITMHPFKSGINLDRATSNIFRKFSGPKDIMVSKLGVRLTNKDSHVMLLGALMTAKNMMMRNPSVKVRNVGVVGVSARDIESEYSIDIINDFKNITAIKEFPELLELIDSDEMKRTISDSVSRSNISTDQEKLIKFYQSGGYSAGTGTKISSSDINKLANGSISDRRAVILKRMGLLGTYIPKTEELEMNYEYRLLSAALINFDPNGQSDRNDISDMSRVGAFFQTPFSIGSDLIQNVYNEVVKTNGIIINETMKWHNVSKKLVDPIINKREGLKRKNIIGDWGGDFFSHLYRTEKGLDEKGNSIDIAIPGMLHVAKNIGTPENPRWEFYDPQTEQLYKEQRLDDDDLKYTWAVANMVREKYAEQIFEENKYKTVGSENRAYTMDDAYDELDDSSYQFGMVPIMDKTMNEMLMKGMFKNAGKRWWDQATNVNSVFQEMLSYENAESQNKLHDVFSSQRKLDNRLAMAGIEINEEQQYVITNRELYDKVGYNLERAAVAFNLSSNRVNYYSDRVLPLYNSANTMMKIYTEMGKDQKNTKIAMQNIIDRVLYHKINETGEGGTVNIAKIVDSGSMLLTYAHIFARPILFFKSTFWNSIQLSITALANTIATNGHFSMKELMNAFKISFSAKGPDKIMKMLRHFNIIDRSEFDMMQHPWLVKSDRNIFQSFYGFIFNYWSDAHARGVTMVAEMMKDGSWDAYSINDEGEVVYDETKDKRMYKDGKLTEEGRILKESIKKDLIDQKLMNESDEILPRGHDIVDADNIKYVSDKYIVGAYDNIAKTNATQHIVGRLATKFRIFAPSRLENLGFFMSTRKTQKGQGREVLRDPETGELISKRETIEMEGMLQSFGRVLGYIKHIKSQPNPAVYWKSLPPIAKNNFIRALAEGAAFAALYGVLIGFGGGDSEEEKKAKRQKKLTYSWMYSDVLSVSLASDIYNNPFPFVDSVDRFMGSFLGLLTEGEVDRNLFTLIPGYGIYKDADAVVNSLSTTNE